MTGFSRTHREAFLVYLYFGSGKDNLSLCIDRAYLDMSRTLWGIVSHPEKLRLHGEATKALKQAMREVAERTPSVNAQAEFDGWHEQTCRKLQEIYVKRGYERFSIGQGQKWVNMTLKYVFTLGEGRLPGFGHLFALCHAPLDNVFLAAITPEGLPKGLRGVTAWSRMDNYADYLVLQKWIRERFAGRTPLDIEFELFTRKPQGLSSPPF